MTAKRTLAGVLATLLWAAVFCAAAAAEELNFGQFRIDWPKGFAAAPNIGSPTFKGPNGERVTFTIDEKRGRSARVADKETMAKMVESTKHLLEGFERDFGRPLWPPKEEKHDNGDVHLTSAFKATGMKTGYAVVRAVVSPRGAVAIIVLEGSQGDPAEAYARFRPAFDTARWL